MEQVPAEQDRRISDTFERERPRLRRFIRQRLADENDTDDVLQDVFLELVEAYRVFQPFDQVSAWLFRVARNRIIDFFRKKKLLPLGDLSPPSLAGEEEVLALEDLLPSPDAGPEAAFARLMLEEELEAALDELPIEQREAFVAHELEGMSFKQLAATTGVGVNTLLTRKRKAVLHLRQRLKDIYDEFAALPSRAANSIPNWRNKK